MEAFGSPSAKDVRGTLPMDPRVMQEMLKMPPHKLYVRAMEMRDRAARLAREPYPDGQNAQTIQVLRDEVQFGLELSALDQKSPHLPAIQYLAELYQNAGHTKQALTFWEHGAKWTGDPNCVKKAADIWEAGIPAQLASDPMRAKEIRKWESKGGDPNRFTELKAKPKEGPSENAADVLKRMFRLGDGKQRERAEPKAAEAIREREAVPRNQEGVLKSQAAEEEARRRREKDLALEREKLELQRRRIEEEEQAQRRRLDLENEAKAKDLALLAERLKLEQELAALKAAGARAPSDLLTRTAVPSGSGRGLPAGDDAKPALARSKTAFWVDETDVVYNRMSCLGKGGFGAVYPGKYLGLTDVAVKVALDTDSNEEASTFLEAEVKVWAELPAHENVVPLLGYRTSPTLLITKLYAGGSMKSFLADPARNWDPALSLRLLADAAVGMTFLHSKGVIHSDFKAEHVLVDDGARTPVGKIADFGLAKVRTRIEDTKGDKAYQYRGLAGATVRYAPPEFFDDEPLRKPSDVWSFGMMCYQVLSRGRDPYDHLNSASAIMKAIFKGDRPPRPGGVPDAVWNTVLLCWVEEPDRRPTMASVAMTLKQAVEQPKAVWVEEADVQIFRDQPLGSGGFGEVFRGRFLGENVAVKVLHATLEEQEAKAMFEAELKMWIDVPRHDNLVPLLGYRTAPTFLVTELCSGGSLKSFLASKGWPKPLSVRMLAHAASGIARLHSFGVVHSDLKADNVLVAVDGSGNPVGKIADFGISKIRTRIEDSNGNKEYQYKGLHGATIRFAPPEFFDHQPMGRQADVWTFGMMCYQVLSGGHDPYSDLTSPAAIMRAIFSGKRPPRPGGVLDDVWGLVESCWEEEPAKRPAMADIATELHRLSTAYLGCRQNGLTRTMRRRRREMGRS